MSFTCYETKGWMFEAPGYPYDSTMGMQEGETKIEKLCLKPGDYQLKSWDDFGGTFDPSSPNYVCTSLTPAAVLLKYNPEPQTASTGLPSR